MSDNDQLLQRVCMTLWGADGRNGLNSRVRATEEDIKKLNETVRSHEHLHTQISTVWITLRWLGLGVAAMVSFAASTPVADFLGRVLRAGVGP